MNRLLINVDALRHNIQVVDGWMRTHGAGWSLVTKVLCGHVDTLRVLGRMGPPSLADSRLANLKALRTTWSGGTLYLRLPHFPALAEIVRLASASVNSELEVIQALDREAARQGRTHGILLMLELGDLREGILPGHLLEYGREILRLKHVRLLGFGANQGCLSGAVPNPDQLAQLTLYKELLELKFQRPVPLISGGSSTLLPLLLDGRVPRAVNHFRIGEAVFLGTDLLNGGILPGLRDDAFTLEVDVVEVKEKSLAPPGEVAGLSPFETFSVDTIQPGQRGYRAIVTLGQLDTDVRGLSPMTAGHELAGASSDLTVVNLGEDPGGLSVGDTLSFRPNYSALLRLMTGSYIEKRLAGDSAGSWTVLADQETASHGDALRHLPANQ